MKKKGLTGRAKDDAIDTAARGVHANLDRYSVGFVDREDGYRPASGTLIRIGEHVFIATVAHAIPTEARQRLHFFGHIKREESELTIRRIGKSKSDYPDVSYLEVVQDELMPLLGKEPCPIQRIDPTNPGKSTHISVIIGVPSDSRCFRVDYPRREMRAASVGIFDSPLTKLEWPKVPHTSKKSKPSVDIFFRYPPDEMRSLDNGAPLDALDPHGLSGGGIWDLDLAESGLWSVENAKLFGIQSSCYAPHRYLRGVRIGHWLELVYRDYPGLRNEIDRIMTPGWKRKTAAVA